MKLKKLSTAVVVCLGLTGFTAGYANEVLLTTDQPAQITYRLAHKNHGGQTLFGELRSADLAKNATIPVTLDNHDLAGLVIISVNGHVLPPSANQFDQPEQCSMTTDKTRTTGALEFALSAHEITCRTYGGVFG